MRSRRSALPLVGLIAAAAIAACQLVAGIEPVERTERVSPEAAVDPPEAAPPADPCEHARPPERPAIDDAERDEDQLAPFVLAMRRLDLIPRPGTIARGFDLDGVCTCDERPFTAGDGGPSCRRRSAAKTCDGDGGIDDHAGTLFARYSSLLDIESGANIDDEIRMGKKTFLFQISEYNGRANDREVRVGILASNGVNERPPAKDAGCATAFVADDAGRPEGGSYLPTWCGDDRWTVTHATTLAEKIRPPAAVRSGKGYVTDYTLVVPIDGDIQLPVVKSLASLADARLVARIVPLDPLTLAPSPNRTPASTNDRFFALEDGSVTGRISARDILAVAGTLEMPGDDAGRRLCTEPLFDEIKKLFCPELDIARSRERDGNLNFSCDAISAVFGFAAAPALDGDLFTAPEPDNGCRPGPDDRPVDAGRDVTYSCPEPPPENAP